MRTPDEKVRPADESEDLGRGRLQGDDSRRPSAPHPGVDVLKHTVAGHDGRLTVVHPLGHVVALQVVRLIVAPESCQQARLRLVSRDVARSRFPFSCTPHVRSHAPVVTAQSFFRKWHTAPCGHSRCSCRPRGSRPARTERGYLRLRCAGPGRCGSQWAPSRLRSARLARGCAQGAAVGTRRARGWRQVTRASWRSEKSE
jgi:hypothetical protein